jgi:hypothetical protein
MARVPECPRQALGEANLAVNPPPQQRAEV